MACFRMFSFSLLFAVCHGPVYLDSVSCCVSAKANWNPSYHASHAAVCCVVWRKHVGFYGTFYKSSTFYCCNYVDFLLKSHTIAVRHFNRTLKSQQPCSTRNKQHHDSSFWFVTSCEIIFLRPVSNVGTFHELDIVQMRMAYYCNVGLILALWFFL